MLSLLLNSKELNQLSNLVVITNDLSSKYEPSSGKLGGIDTGNWYYEAYNNKVIDPNNDFLLPIIFVMDKTTISSSINLHVYAVMFNTTLFKRGIRNLASACIPLGYNSIDWNYYSTS